MDKVYNGNAISRHYLINGKRKDTASGAFAKNKKFIQNYLALLECETHITSLTAYLAVSSLYASLLPHDRLALPAQLVPGLFLLAQ